MNKKNASLFLTIVGLLSPLAAFSASTALKDLQYGTIISEPRMSITESLLSLLYDLGIPFLIFIFVLLIEFIIGNILLKKKIVTMPKWFIIMVLFNVIIYFLFICFAILTI